MIILMIYNNYKLCWKSILRIFEIILKQFSLACLIHSRYSLRLIYYFIYIWFIFTSYNKNLVPTRVPIDTQFQADERFADRRENVYSARTYFYEGEQKCNENVDTFKRCIQTAGKNNCSYSFILESVLNLCLISILLLTMLAKNLK